MTFSNIADAGTARILFPPFNADNPSITFLGNNIHSLSVKNATIADSLRKEIWLGDSVQGIMLSNAADNFSVEYDITFPYAPNGSLGYRTVLPGKSGSASGYFQGNYVFCVPAYESDVAKWWRRPLAIEISRDTRSIGPAYGLPASLFSCFTIYELLFLQWAITNTAQQCGPSGNTVASLSVYPLLDDITQKVCDDVSKINSWCSLFFPAPRAPATVIFQDSGSGMEGTFSFYAFLPQPPDYPGYIRGLVTHEAMHSWVGIRCGDLNDPWWKEGTTSYFGRYLAARLGFSKETIRGQLVRDLSANPSVLRHALSDPYVRQHLYDADTNTNCLALVYDKGDQVSVVLDKLLRVATNNSQTLFSKTGALCTQYDHTGFSRSEFKAVLELGNSLDLTDYFARYVDSPGAIDTAVLSDAWRVLDSLKAFDPVP